jgi:hypothetical protein
MDVPAGWYPDPASPTTSARWWDGASWTDHTRGLDELAAPEQPATPSYDAPSADTVVVPVAEQSPDFVAPFVPAAPAAYSDTAVYPSGAAYDATLFPDAAPARSSSPHWGVLALVGALVVALLVAGVLVVKSLTSGSSAPAASRPTPTASAPLTPSPTPPSTDPPTPPGATSPDAIAAGKVLETFKPTTAVLPSGIDATLIPGGDVAEGQRTLDGWCSTSYATEKDRIARRQWALTQDGRSIGLSVEVVAYGTPEQAAAALEEFTAKTDACSGVEVDEGGDTVTQDVVSAKRMTGLPAGITGYRAVATMSGQGTDGTPIRVNSTSTVQRKGQYISIVWTNQATPISAADQHVIDGFVAQQTRALAATS